MKRQDHPAHQDHGSASRPYLMFALNMILSLVVMYLAMFTMIDAPGDFRNNINMLYMAVTMWAPMGIVMLLTMRGMYGNRRLNAALYAAFVVLFAASLAGTRTQALVGDRQFIASMVPHHAGAILMCREAALADQELLQLCEAIARGQRQEIEQMNAIRARLDGSGKPGA